MAATYSEKKWNLKCMMKRQVLEEQDEEDRPVLHLSCLQEEV